jgi:hypothetical protein
MAHGTKKRMGSPYSTIDNPNYGGALKPTTPPIKKHTASQPKTPFQKSDAADEARFNRGATTNRQEQLRKVGQKPAASRGKNFDIAGATPSKRIGHGPGYDNSKGYAKR